MTVMRKFYAPLSPLSLVEMKLIKKQMHLGGRFLFQRLAD
jgi:hypothetical protein